MSMTDPIADLLSRIRNGHLAKHDRLDAPASKLKIAICQILKDEGFIADFEVLEPDSIRSRIRVFLRYTPQGEPAIRHLRRVSTPGRRVYQKADQLKPVLNGLGVGIVSTSRGLLTDKQAREARVGGELLCELW